MRVSSGPKAGRLLFAVGMMFVLAVVVSACGSSSSSSSSTGSTEATSEESTASTETAASIPPYNGPEKGLPGKYPEPEVIKGEKFVVGYLNPNASVETLVEEEEGVKETAEKLGGSMISYDTQSDPQKQAADFKLLLSQGVTAIVLQPSDPVSLAPAVKEATEKGIPIVAVSTPADVPTPNLPNYITNTMQGEDQCAYDNARAIAEVAPGSSFVAMGTVLPYPALEYGTERAIYWGKKLGLKYLGEVQTKFANPSDGAETMSTVLAKYPEAESVMTWLDSVALGASTTARANGKSDIRILGVNGEKAAREAVASGQLFATCKYEQHEGGEQATIAAYDAQTEQHLPLPEKVVTSTEEITKSNAP